MMLIFNMDMMETCANKAHQRYVREIINMTFIIFKQTFI